MKIKHSGKSEYVKHSLNDYIVRYSIIVFSIGIGLYLISAMFNMDILILPIFYVGVEPFFMIAAGMVLVWLFLWRYSKSYDINKLKWFNKKTKKEGDKGVVITSLILFVILVGMIYNFIKYKSVFVIYLSNNSNYKEITMNNDLVRKLSIMAIVFVILTIIDLVQYHILEMDSLSIVISASRLYMLYQILQESASKLFNLDMVYDFTLQKNFDLGIYVLLVMAMIGIVFSFVRHINNLCFQIHDSRIQKNSRC